MTKEQSPLTLPLLFLFWLPLALMWILMSIEQPALNGVMARLPAPTLSLAAFEVAFGVALIIESPIIQMLSTGTAVVRGPRSYRQMIHFMHVLAILLATAHFILSRPVVFHFIAVRIMGIPEEVALPARRAFTILILFAPLVGYRRLWQGGLIQLGETGAVAKTMVVRLVVTLGALFMGIVVVRSGHMVVPGYVVGALALMAGIGTGAAASWWYYWKLRKFDSTPDRPDDQVRTIRSLLAFYVPLSLTSVMELASRPILAFGIARSVMAMDSLSTWPVVNSLFFLFSSIALSFQEAVVAQAGRSTKNIPVLVKFGLILMAALAGLFLLITMTGGSRFWFRVVAGLPPSLVDLAQPAMYILIVLPVAVTLRSLLSGILVAREKTGFLTIAVSANTVVLLTLVVVLPRFTDLVGTIVAAIALVSAVTAQALVLWLGNYLSRRTARRINGPAVPAAS
ncbi:MAG: hypothetical protein WCY01_10015 [Alkalispirochaeta sp.]|jgi:O-antigen/teichoic acid export membrane protein